MRIGSSSSPKGASPRPAPTTSSSIAAASTPISCPVSSPRWGPTPASPHERSQTPSARAPIVLVLPGYANSGPAHWQTLWERARPGFRRVQQRDWEEPRRADWVEAIDRAVVEAGGPVVFAGHSLGSIAAVHWAARALDDPA